MYAGRMVEIARATSCSTTRAIRTRWASSTACRASTGSLPALFQTIPGQPPDLLRVDPGLLVRTAVRVRHATVPRRTLPMLTPAVAPTTGPRAGTRPRWSGPRHQGSAPQRRRDESMSTAARSAAVPRDPGRTARSWTHVTSRCTSPSSRTSLLRSHHEVVHALDGVSLSIQRGETVGPGRRDRLRQVHARPRDRRPLHAHRGPACCSTAWTSRRSAVAGAALAAPALPDRVPGPVPVAQPADDRRRLIGEGLAIHDIGKPEGAGRPRRRADGRGGPAAGSRLPVPARVLGRPAPAHRDRAGPRAEPGAHRAGRARVVAGRLHPGADPAPARGPAAASSGSPTSSSATISP